MVDQRPSGSVTETDSGSHARIYVQIMLHNDAHCDPNIVAQMDAHYDLLQGQTPPISLLTFDLSHYLESRYVKTKFMQSMPIYIFPIF